MVKNFVLDTNILIHCPDAVLKFEDNNVYIPHIVIEELDNLKTTIGEVGYSAREALRVIKDLRTDGKELSEGIDTPEGGKLYVFTSEEISRDFIPDGWSLKKPDNLILMAAKELSIRMPNVFMITNDVNVQIKADTLKIPFQEYRNDRVSKTESYSGRCEVHLDDEDFQSLIRDGKITSDKIYESDISFLENQFVTVKTWQNSGWLAKYSQGKLLSLEHKDENPSDLIPRNAGQTFLQESLLSDKPLTICAGPAGTGKTLFAIGCGLEQVMNQKIYKKVLLCRPNITMEEDIGFLPGTEFEKISPLLRGCYDNLEQLFGNMDDTREMINDKIDELFSRGYIEAEAIAYLRGRSIANTFIIIDEAQNASPSQILSIITRAGEGSKIVLLGDPDQIDNNRLDKWNNGLIYAKERLKGESLVEIVSFNENECTRSPLAKLASEKLKK